MEAFVGHRFSGQSWPVKVGGRPPCAGQGWFAGIAARVPCTADLVPVAAQHRGGQAF